MRIWFLLAGLNIFIALFCIGCINIQNVYVPEDSARKIASDFRNPSVIFINKGQKNEVKNDVKNDAKPTGQKQIFENINPDGVPTIKELEK